MRSTPQQYSSNGTFRSERETAEFRGTTIYASPYAHAGKDQCPRDDLFSALHVFLDLALGDLPWRAAAKNKNKTAVASLKQDLLTDSDLFLDGIVVQLEESIGDAASQVCERSQTFIYALKFTRILLYCRFRRL